VPTRRQQLRGAIDNGLLRPGPDHTYADGDDSTWIEVDWPSMTRRVTVDGREVNVVDTGGSTQPTSSAGTGGQPAMVFVHGLGGAWQNWLLNIPAFMGSHRVIAPDLPGFGESPMPRDEISIKGYARILDELLDKLGVESAVLVGNSMGGFVAAEVARSSPEMVNKLVLVSAAGITSVDLKRSPGPVVLKIGAALATYTAARFKQIAARPYTRHFALSLVARHPSLLAPDVAYEGLMKGAGKEGFDDALRATLDYDFRDRLDDIACETLIVWGRNDAVLPARDADEYERLIPHSRKIVLDDTGHIPMVERPAAFNDTVSEFFGGEAVGEPTEGPASEAAV
jgi:pimeloyl-ACP methyl ester carboxylesterase